MEEAENEPVTLRAALPDEDLCRAWWGWGAETFGVGLQDGSGQIAASTLGKRGYKRLVGICRCVLVGQMGRLSLAQPWSISEHQRALGSGAASEHGWFQGGPNL